MTSEIDRAALRVHLKTLGLDSELLGILNSAIESGGDAEVWSVLANLKSAHQRLPAVLDSLAAWRALEDQHQDQDREHEHAIRPADRRAQSGCSLLIVCHMPLASSLQAVAQHAYPDCSGRLVAVDVAPGATLVETEQQVRTALAALPEGDVLILADVFGATPCSAALAAADGVRTRVVAGVNVPMLWRTLCYCDMPLDDLVARAVAGAAQGTMHVAVPRRQNQPHPPASLDPLQHPDDSRLN